ncbi:MAG: hypothetical protein IKV03_02835 [Alphaproteobacteria bacterium]|nr:hypothetical protein [Alphaproteobacteria bacterium]
MFKKKQRTHQSSSQSIPTESKKENPKRQKRRSRHIFRLVVLLLVCATLWAAYDNLKKNVAKTNIKTNAVSIQSAKEIPVNPTDVDTSGVKVQSTPSKPDTKKIQKKESKDETPSTQSEPQTTKHEKPETTVIKKQDITASIVPETTNVIQDIENIPVTKQETENIPIAELEQQIESSFSDTDTYSLRDALIFRDHFLSEQPCGDDFRKLILSNKKQAVIQDVIKTTSYFCLTTNNIYLELNNLFKKSKQNALIKYYYTQDSEWVAELKSIAIRFIQIRNLNPISDDIPSILDRAQNTLIEKNIAQTVELIASLPDYLQPEFETFLEKAQNYADASAALENLILSYAKGE